MTLDYEPSTPEPPNHYQLIDSDDEMETSEKLLITSTKPRLATTVQISTQYGKY